MEPLTNDEGIHAMNTMMVGYDLNRPGQNYDALIEEIKSLGAWWHHLDSTWLVKTDLSHVEVRDRLVAHIDKGDEMLVIDVTSRASAWRGFSDSGSEWIKKNL